MHIQETAKKLASLYATTHEDRPDNALWNAPDSAQVVEGLKVLIRVMFPGNYPAKDEPLEIYFAKQLQIMSDLLGPEIERAIPYRWLPSTEQKIEAPGEVKKESKKILKQFIAKLPSIRTFVVDDVIAAYNGDPAALSYAEVKLAYPGLLAITSHRIAHELYQLDVPIIPRIMNEWTHARAGIDIHPGATIGRRFFMDHGTGVVIGETTKIGDHVKIYQGVTLGAKSFPLDEYGNPIKHIQRHPTVENNVVIYANTTVLGGKTVLGHDSIIGGNVFLLESVPPHSFVTKNKSEAVVRTQDTSGLSGRS